jgi:hypothetical protein
MGQRARYLALGIGMGVMATLAWQRASADGGDRFDAAIAILWTLSAAGYVFGWLPVKLPSLPPSIQTWLGRLLLAGLATASVAYIAYLTWMSNWIGLSLLAALLILLATFIYGLNGHLAIKAWFVSLTRKS